MDILTTKVEELVNIRKNPLLLLNLPGLGHRSVIKVQKELTNKKFDSLDVLLQTPGGNIDAAYNIVKILRKCSTKLNIIVPLYAKSAGTLICLGADKILLTVISELGPLDTQIKESREGDVNFKSALNGFKALEQIQVHALENLDNATKLILQRSDLRMFDCISLGVEFSGKTGGCLYNKLDPISIGEYKRALEISEKYGVNILTRFMSWNEDKAKSVINSLVYGYPSHDFIVDLDELKELDIPADEIPSDQLDIVEELRMLLLQAESDIVKLVVYKKRKKQ